MLDFKKLLIIQAHIDDMEIGMGAYLLSKVKFLEEIYIVTICGNGRNGSVEVIENQSLRLQEHKRFLDSLRKENPKLKVKELKLNYHDLETTDIHTLMKILMKNIENLKGYNAVFSPTNDFHDEHNKARIMAHLLSREGNFNIPWRFEFIIDYNTISLSSVFPFDYIPTFEQKELFKWKSEKVFESKLMVVKNNQEFFREYFKIEKATL